MHGRPTLSVQVVGLSLLCLASCGAALASGPDQTASSPDWFSLGMGLFGGLALFLSGLQLLSEGLKKAAGQTLRVVMERLTTNRLMGAITGAFVTAVLNSSSVTTVLVVSFVTAGVMTLGQSVGVIMGANIGSTITAQLLAFNLSRYALLPVAVGFFMMSSAKRERLRFYGMMVMGLGLVFFGMGLMSQAMDPLRSYPPFLGILERMARPLLGVLAGALFTALVQSSAATMGIAIAMASQGLLSLPAGIALALGANIGTCVTALVAALGKPTDAVRAAMVHVLFNVLGVLVWLPFLWLLSDVAVRVSPQSLELSEAARAAADVPRQIANANTLFNIANTLLFIGFTGLFAKLAERLVPERSPQVGAPITPEFLDPVALKAPSLALERVRQELGRVGGIVESMFTDLRAGMGRRSREQLAAVSRDEGQLHVLETAILDYLAALRRETLTEEEGRAHEALMTAAINLEALADVIGTDLVERARLYLDQDLTTGPQSQEILETLYENVGRALNLSVQAVRFIDQRAAAEVASMKGEVDRAADRFLERKAERLGTEDAKYLASARAEMVLVEKLRHIYTLARRVAKVVLLPATAAQ